MRCPTDVATPGVADGKINPLRYSLFNLSGALHQQRPGVFAPVLAVGHIDGISRLRAFAVRRQGVRRAKSNFRIFKNRFFKKMANTYLNPCNGLLYNALGWVGV